MFPFLRLIQSLIGRQTRNDTLVKVGELMSLDKRHVEHLNVRVRANISQKIEKYDFMLSVKRFL